MALFIVLCLSIYSVLTVSENKVESKQKLLLYALSSVSLGQSGGYIVGAQRLAVNDINNRIDILPNYELHIELINSNNSKTTSLKSALSISSTNSLLWSEDNSTIIIPIVLGMPWSSLSIMTAPALAAFNWSQISSSATSILLSDSSSYPTFYRTPPSDDLQAIAIIKLCQQFNWTNIGIININDNYGVYLTNNLLELAPKYNIRARASSFFF